MTLDTKKIRQNFPSISIQRVFLDNPAGTQVPQGVIDAVSNYYTSMNANAGGTFATSQRSDEMVQSVRQSMADFLHASRPEEIVFGPNMTTLNFNLSRALAKTLKPGDEIVLTRMDHDANIAPWLLIAEDHDLVVRWVDIDPSNCTLDMDSLEAALTDRTRIVATIHASNAAGTINPVNQIAEMAHAAGAYFVVDAVQSAPHIPIDVQAIDCDFLLCSAYKFFGPHIGILWGRYELLESLPVYKVRPAKDKPPYRWETGTPSFETIAGVGAALDYLAEIGLEFGLGFADEYPRYTGQALDLKLGMEAIRQHEHKLVKYLLAVLARIPNMKVYGITDPARLSERVPTVACSIGSHTPLAVAQHLAKQNIYVWSGDYYAQEIMVRLGHGEDGLVRIGLAHYNTHEEIDRLEQALRSLG